MGLRTVRRIGIALILGLSASALTPLGASAQVSSLPAPKTAAAVAAAGSFASIPGRLAGDDRYETAVKAAQVWDDFFTAEIVFLATGENFPDALSASAAAARLGAPVLLTQKRSLPTSVRNELRALDPDLVVVLGSTAAISSSVARAVGDIVGDSNVLRFAGEDRYDTMRQVIEFAWYDPVYGLAQAPPVVIATGRNFPDALAAGPGVALDGGAVVLVDGSSSKVPAATMALLRDLRPYEIVIAGSSVAVSNGIERALEREFGERTVVRVAGSDRYETSRKLNIRLFEGRLATHVFLATGENFPDALSGAALAGSLGAALFTTPGDCMSRQLGMTVSLGDSFFAGERTLLGSKAVLSYQRDGWPGCE